MQYNGVRCEVFLSLCQTDILMKRVFAFLVLACLSLNASAQSYDRANDIVYRQGEPTCNLDVAYPAEKGENLPVVVWFHGGGLTKGRKSVPKDLLTGDKIVVGVEYRLHPSVSVAQIIDDSALAVSWVFGHIAEYGGSPQKIVLSGHSAGGYLVTMLAMDKKYLAAYDVDANDIAAVVPYSGQMITHYTERATKGIDPLTPVIDDLAPIAHLRADAPPMVIITGDRELELYGRYEENAYFVRMLKLHGHKDVTLYELQGFGHSMTKPGHCILNKFMRSVERK